MNIFEQASRKKLRFPSAKGDLSTEQLWDTPLTSNNTFNLDQIARGVNHDLKGVTEESFVATKPDPRKPDLELKLEIVKHVIAVKLKAKQDAEAAASRSLELKKLTEALASKEDEALSSLSREEILKRMQELQAS